MAARERMAKLTPSPVNVAPRMSGEPSFIRRTPQEHGRERRQPDAQRVRKAVHHVREGLIARDAREARRRRSPG